METEARRRWPRGLVALSVLLAGCTGTGSIGSAPPAPTPEPTPAPVCGNGVVEDGELCDDGVNDHLDGGCLPGCEEQDLIGEVFDGHLLEIDIEVDPADWDAMRVQRKTRHSIFGATDCRTEPVVNPYTWFEVTVTIDGEVIEGAGVRKKGHFGSQSTTVPSMKLKFDEFGDGGRFHTMKRLALNNSKSDRSYLRDCAAYRHFEQAGAPAVRCTHARVSVNGEFLGMYGVTEEIKRPFLRRRFEDATGNLYEGTACDWRPEFVGGFEQETNEEIDASRADLAAVYDVVQDAPDEDLEEALAELIDLDAFFTFWAVEGLLWHRDGYSGNANNYFLYADPADDGRFRFIPWGPDGTLRVNNNDAMPDSVLAYGVITNRLYATPVGRDRYYGALEEVVDALWDPDAFDAEAARVAALFEPHLDEAGRAELSAAMDEVSGIYRSRPEVIEQAIAAGYPDWTLGLRFDPCRTPLAAISGTFDTTWDSLGTGWADSGSAALEIDGEPVEATLASSRAGPLADGRARVQLRFDATGDLRYVFTFNLAEPPWFESYSVPGDHDLGTPPVWTNVVLYDTSGDSGVELDRFDAAEGTWTFEEIERVAGAAVVGSFDGTLWDRP